MDRSRETTLLEEMRSGRESANSAFIHFTECHICYTTHVFCFYEGEDGKYYNQKIKSVLGENIIAIKAGNKKEVLKVWRKLSSDSHYEKISKCFFVDKDMDELPVDLNEDLYITPCYSIENLYTTTNVLTNILQSEFSCEKYDSDYQKCIDKFIQLQDQFNEIMIEFNALVLLRKKKNLGSGIVCLSDFKTTKLFVMSCEKVQKHKKYNDEINKLKLALSTNEIEMSEYIDKIKGIGNYNSIFRGKNQLDFFVSFIELLKELHKSRTFFEHTHASVTINLSNNRLSELSQYAEFPTCLKKFLERHKIPD